MLLASQSSLAYGAAVGAAGYRVDNADQTQAAGRQGGAGAEDAAVRVGGLWIARGCGFSDVVAGRRGLCGRSVFDGEAERLSAPLLQGEHHGQVLTCGEKRRRRRNKSTGIQLFESLIVNNTMQTYRC